MRHRGCGVATVAQAIRAFGGVACGVRIGLALHERGRGLQPALGVGRFAPLELCGQALARPAAVGLRLAMCDVNRRLVVSARCAIGGMPSPACALFPAGFVDEAAAFAFGLGAHARGLHEGTKGANRDFSTVDFKAANSLHIGARRGGRSQAGPHRRGARCDPPLPTPADLAAVPQLHSGPRPVSKGSGSRLHFSTSPMHKYFIST